MTEGHRVTEDWMGTPVETLEDLLRPGLRAVCVGINPAPDSVRAGHYYQGKLGQQFYGRLRRAGVLPRAAGWEDDLAFELGLGFTDIVKRPTGGSKEVRPEEFAHGRPLLEAKIEAAAPKLLLFVFKETAKKLFGPFGGNGLLAGRTLAGAEIFVMPGPYAPREEVAQRVDELGELL
jgi:TDG/mug DNA glycosylase family protein